MSTPRPQSDQARRATSYALEKLPQSDPPTLLTDARRFPGTAPETVELDRARTWSHRSGPSQFLIRHPELRGAWKARRID